MNDLVMTNKTCILPFTLGCFLKNISANDKSLTIVGINEYDRFSNAFTQSFFSIILSVAVANHDYI